MAVLFNLKTLEEMIKLLWREVPSQFRQQFVNILHNRLMFASLNDKATFNISHCMLSNCTYQHQIPACH